MLMESRDGLVRNTWFTHASGHGGRDVALAMDKGYDSAGFVANCRAAGVTPHVARNTTNRCSARSRVARPAIAAVGWA